MTEIKDIVAVAGAVIGASVGIFNWRATRFRGKLKDDLDIQKRYREELLALGNNIVEIEENEHYRALQSSINRKIIQAYVYKGTDWSDLTIAACCVLLSWFIWQSDNQLPSSFRTASLFLFVSLSTIFAVKSIHDRKKPHAN